jgi:hypothetical protein
MLARVSASLLGDRFPPAAPAPEPSGQVTARRRSRRDRARGSSGRRGSWARCPVRRSRGTDCATPSNDCAAARSAHLGSHHASRFRAPSRPARRQSVATRGQMGHRNPMTGTRSASCATARACEGRPSMQVSTAGPSCPDQVVGQLEWAQKGRMRRFTPADTAITALGHSGHSPTPAANRNSRISETPSDADLSKDDPALAGQINVCFRPKSPDTARWALRWLADRGRARPLCCHL